MGKVSILQTSIWYRPAPEIYQREMEMLFKCVPAEIRVDDFLINAKDEKEMVLERGRQVG